VVDLGDALREHGGQLRRPVNGCDRRPRHQQGSRPERSADGHRFSAFGWAYVIAQLPGGWLLDRYGSKTVYACSLALWSMFTIAQGFVGFLTGGFAAVMSDAAPQEITGLAGAVFNMCGNPQPSPHFYLIISER